MNEDRPVCQRRNCSPLNVLFSDIQIDIASRSSARVRQTTLRWQNKSSYTHGCRALTWRQLGFLVGVSDTLYIKCNLGTNTHTIMHTPKNCIFQKSHSKSFICHAVSNNANNPLLGTRHTVSVVSAIQLLNIQALISLRPITAWHGSVGLHGGTLGSPGQRRPRDSM